MTHKIDYENMTPEFLEEWIEFVDWNQVPSSAITEHMKNSIRNIGGLSARIALNNMLDKLEVIPSRCTDNYIILFFDGKPELWTIQYFSKSKNVFINKEIFMPIFKKYRISQITAFLQKPVEELLGMEKEKVKPKLNFSVRPLKNSVVYTVRENDISKAAQRKQ